VRGKLLALIAVGIMLAVSCGCMMKAGGVSPTWGRAEPSYSSGANLHLPLGTPEEPGRVGTMIAFPYEEFRTNLDEIAGFSKGALRTSVIGMEFRLMWLLHFKDSPSTGTKPAGEVSELTDAQWREEKKRDQSLFFFWFGAGPEYRYNTFVPSASSVNRAAIDNIVFQENFENKWGGRISFGILTWTRSFDHELKRDTGGIGIILEFGYHWGEGRVERIGTDNGSAFRTKKDDAMEWLSLYLGLGIEF
jgi:hypothetical protein